MHKNVAWEHDTILGGNSKQRVSYDQLWSQWVQGFVRNILEGKSNRARENMLNCLSDSMVDTTDFSWQGTNASHAVLLFDMERGRLLEMTHVVLTELEEYNPKSTFKTLEFSIEVVKILENVSGIVNFFKLDHVLSLRTMRQMVRSINTSVLTAWIKGRN